MDDQIKRTAEFVGYATAIITAAVASWRVFRPLVRLYCDSRPIKKLETRVERLAAKIHLLVSLHGDSIYVCDHRGSCVWASQRLADLFGMSPEQMVGNGWVAAIAHEDRQRALSRWRHAIDTGLPYRDEYSIVVDGLTKRIVTEAYRHKSDSGEVVFYVGWAAVDDGQRHRTISI